MGNGRVEENVLKWYIYLSTSYQQKDVKSFNIIHFISSHFSSQPNKKKNNQFLSFFCSPKQKKTSYPIAQRLFAMRNKRRENIFFLYLFLYFLHIQSKHKCVLSSVLEKRLGELNLKMHAIMCCWSGCFVVFFSLFSIEDFY